MPFVFDNPNHHGSGFYFDDPSETSSGSGGGGDNGGGSGVNMTAQSLLVKQNWTKVGNAYVGDNPAGDSIEAFLASQNTAVNSSSAIWASSQVTDGNGTGTFADPYSLRGAIYSAGLGDEVVLKDDGTYQLTNPMNLASNYDDTTYPDSFNGGGTGGTAWGGGNPKVVTMSTAKPTQESERITVRGEQGTLPTIDCQEMRFISLESNSYMTFRALKFINTREVFHVYTGSNYLELDLLAVEMSLGGDNFSPFKLDVGAEYGSLTRSHIQGPGTVADGVNANTNGVYNRHNNHWTYSNLTIHNFPLGLYFKHPNDPSDVGGVANVTGLVENVHVYNTDRDFGSNFSGNGYTFRNCLLNGIKMGATGGTGANGVAFGGSDCTFENVTFIGRCQFDGDGLANGGSNDPTITDCVFGERLDGLPSDTTPDFNATSNYNLFSQNAFLVNTVTETFAQWKTGTGGDANSIQATPSFVGSDESVPSDWALQANTSGAGAASNGSDMGCDVSLVGVKGQ